MIEKYKNNAIELKKNIEVLDNTFSKFGLKILNVGGLDYAEFLGGNGIKFFVEIMSDEDIDSDDYLQLKINVYDENDDLISMGSTGIDMSEFSGYDTVDLVVFADDIFERAVKARVYLAKS